jgi:hypothetical protein
MDFDVSTPDQIVRIVDKINDHLVYEGLPERLEHLVPLLSFNYAAGEFGVEFCGFNLWDSVNDNMFLGEDGLENFLLARIAEIRKVFNHATSGIQPSAIDTLMDDNGDKL